jgi:hypothetical protein
MVDVSMNGLLGNKQRHLHQVDDYTEKKEKKANHDRGSKIVSNLR